MEMTAAVIKGEKHLEMEQVNFDPAVQDGEVLIRVDTSAICGTDIHLYTGARKPAKTPLILGHECSGTIEATGDTVTKFHVGDRVVLQPNYACDSCEACLTGRYNICMNRPIPGVNIDGCFTRYIKAPARFVWHLPDELSFAEGSLVEPASVALHAVKRSRASAGETAVVIGLGPIGNFVMQMLRISGVTVIGMDIQEERGNSFLKIGGDYFINPEREDSKGRINQITAGFGADLVFECAGLAATAELAVTLPRPGGRVVLLGLSGEDAKFKPIMIARQEIEILGSIIYVQEFRHVIDMFRKQKVNLKDVMGPTFALEDTMAALKLASDKKHLKILIKCND